MPTQARKHFFRDDDDNRTVVETSLTRKGDFQARTVEADEVQFVIFGYGHSRLAAIADLQARLEAVQ